MILRLPAGRLQEMSEGDPGRAGSLASQAAKAQGHRIDKTIRNIQAPLAYGAHQGKPSARGCFFQLVEVASWTGSQA